MCCNHRLAREDEENEEIDKGRSNEVEEIETEDLAIHRSIHTCKLIPASRLDFLIYSYILYLYNCKIEEVIIN